MIVTIDGPAGAGKSTTARALAERLGFRFLDTGAMYRAVALAVHRSGIGWDDAAGIARLAEDLNIELQDDRVLLDGVDVSQAIRTVEITSHTRHVADSADVRRLLIRRQRELARDCDVVTEGRDQATEAFPDAEVKIFLTAGEQERAKRRQHDLLARGEKVHLDDILQQQRTRDHRDTTRGFGALKKAADAVEVCTDGLSLDQVVDRLESIVRSRQGG